jgi:hypothetical protein
MTAGFTVANMDFFMFLAIEILIAVAFFICFKYSRKHRGIFDRRFGDRRAQNTSLKNGYRKSLFGQDIRERRTNKDRRKKD